MKVGLADRDGFLARLMLLPSIVYIVALVAVPFVLAIAYSFSDVTAGDPSFDWVGLDNYRANWRDPVFRQALWNSIFFTTVTMVLDVVSPTSSPSCSRRTSTARCSYASSSCCRGPHRPRSGPSPGSSCSTRC